MEATSGSLPVIAICNGVVQAHDGMGAFQELDAVALMRPVTKWAIKVTAPRRVSWVVERAFSIAVNGRPGAVFVEIEPHHYHPYFERIHSDRLDH